MCRYLFPGKPLFRLFWFLDYVFALDEFVIEYFSISLIT